MVTLATEKRDYQLGELAGVLFEKVGFEPTGEEQARILRGGQRFKAVAGGEQAGKSLVASKEWLLRWSEDSKAHPGEELLYWLVAADYERTKAEFQYIVEDLMKLGLPVEATKRVDPGAIEVRFKGEEKARLRVETKSGKDPRTLAMFAPHGIILCEASQVDLETYMKCQARVAPRRGWLFASGCLTGDTLIATDEGMLELGALVGNTTHPVDIGILGMSGGERSKLAFYNGRQPIKRVRLTKGYEIAGTPNHRVITRLRDGSVTWKELQALKPEDLVAIRYGMGQFGGEVWDAGDAYLAGLYIAEGCWDATEIPMQGRMIFPGVGRHAPNGLGKGRKGIPVKQQRTKDRITFTTGDAPLAAVLEARGYRHYGFHYRLTDNSLAATFRAMGIDPLWKAHTKRVPRGIMRGTKECVVAFLQGLFDGDGTAQSGGKNSHHRRISYCTVSKRMAKEVQALLLNLGVATSLTIRPDKSKTVDVNVLDASQFVEHVGFRLERKQTIACAIAPPAFFRNQANAGGEFLGYPVLWCSPIAIEDDVAETFDLHVPGSHAYWANGLIVHNTYEGSLGWWPGVVAAWAYGGKDEASFRLPSPTNKHRYPLGENDPEILRLKRTSSDAFFLERIMGIASPPRGMVYSNEFRPDVHIREVEYDPSLPFHIWEDPGYGHAHCILFVQKVPGGQVRVFYEIYERGIITEDLIDVCLLLPWWKNENKKLVIDPNYAQQHHGTRSIAEIWLAKTGLVACGTKTSIGDGTERVKSFLKVNPLTGEPGIVFSPQCKGILSEMGAYPNPFDGQTRVYSWKMDREGNVIGDEPDDKNNDGCKALAYGLVEEFGLVTTSGRKSLVMTHHGGRQRRTVSLRGGWR